MEIFSYDGKAATLEKVIDVYKRGSRILCAICGSELIIINSGDLELIKNHNLSPGIYCPVSPKHIYQVFIFADPFEKFRQKFGGNE